MIDLKEKCIFPNQTLGVLPMFYWPHIDLFSPCLVIVHIQSYVLTLGVLHLHTFILNTLEVHYIV